MSDRITFQHEVAGLAVPVEITAEYEPADPFCGQSGGWFVSEVGVNRPGVPGGPPYDLLNLDRDEFSYLFGSLALRVAEETASDLAASRVEELEMEGAL